MRTVLSAIILLSLSLPLLAADSVSMPWEEFKRLYTESIVRNMAGTQTNRAEEAPFIYTIQDAAYHLKVEQGRARGKVVISGMVISGDPEPIALFGSDVILARTEQLVGGDLLAGETGAGRIMFLPGAEKEFQVVLSFLVRPREDERSKLVSFAAPHALRNSLELEPAPQVMLLEQPGIADERGVYHFSAARSLEVRFRDKQDISATSLVDVNTFSHVRMQGKRAIVTTTFVPVQPMPAQCTLQVQEGAQYISSSLKSSWIKEKDGSSYTITVPSREKRPFTMQFAVEESGVGGFKFRLPHIRDNNGREGNFALEEPDDAQLTISGQGLVTGLPVAKLGPELAAAAGGERSYRHIEVQESVTISIRRFSSVSTPPIVLDSQQFFVAFEENGNVLSVLAADIPPEIGPRLRLRAVPDAEIWSLTVNGRSRKVYSNEESSWIIPLDGVKSSRIELALLQKGEKLGLHGRLEATLPSTGLASRTVSVGIALPERVQLLSLEGPVSPAPRRQGEAPAEFIGNPHFFSRAFYKGEGMQLAISYKEPVKNNQK